MTKEEYFAPNNRVLTNSKIKDFNLDPFYFYRKHILGDIEAEKAGHYAVGSAVDDLLTQINSKDKFVCVSRRNLKNPPVGVIELNPTQYNEVIELASAVEDTTAWKDLKKHGTFQETLLVPTRLGPHFDMLGGIPDHLYIDEDAKIGYITDLKTAQTVDSEKYYWHCLEFGYFRQAALYRHLVQSLHPHIRKYVNRHIVVEKSKELYRVRTFELSQLTLDEVIFEVMADIDRIAHTVAFLKSDATWEDAKLIGQVCS